MKVRAKQVTYTNSGATVEGMLFQCLLTDAELNKIGVQPDLTTLAVTTQLTIMLRAMGRVGLTNKVRALTAEDTRHMKVKDDGTRQITNSRRPK